MGVGCTEGETGTGASEEEDANWERRSRGGLLGGGVEYCRFCRDEGIDKTRTFRLRRHCCIGRETLARIADCAEARIGN